MFVSETYSIYDVLFKDIGTERFVYNTGAVSDTWHDNIHTCEILTVSSAFFSFIHINWRFSGNKPSLTDIKGKTITLEFDYRTTANNCQMQYYHDIGNGWATQSSSEYLTASEDWNHYKKTLTFSNDLVKAWWRLSNTTIGTVYELKNIIIYTE